MGIPQVSMPSFALRHSCMRTWLRARVAESARLLGAHVQRNVPVVAHAFLAALEAVARLRAHPPATRNKLTPSLQHRSSCRRCLREKAQARCQTC
eukprot:108865-Pleurochrysis_carterae.AAC.2